MVITVPNHSIFNSLSSRRLRSRASIDYFQTVGYRYSSEGEDDEEKEDNDEDDVIIDLLIFFLNFGHFFTLVPKRRG